METILKRPDGFKPASGTKWLKPCGTSDEADAAIAHLSQLGYQYAKVEFPADPVCPYVVVVSMYAKNYKR